MYGFLVYASKLNNILSTFILKILNTEYFLQLFEKN